MISSASLDTQFLPTIPSSTADKSSVQKTSDKQSSSDATVPEKFQKTLEQEATRKTQSEPAAKKSGMAKKADVPRKMDAPKKVDVDTVDQETAESSSPMSKKQAILSDFLTQMEEKFSIAPERLVQAMTELSEDELERSPESTMNLVLNQLSLKGPDRHEAAKLYQNMLNEAASAEAEDASNQAQIPMIEMQVLSQKDVNQKDLDRGLDSMNKNFFQTEKKNKQVSIQPQQQLQQPNNEQIIGAAAMVPGQQRQDAMVTNEQLAQSSSKRAGADAFFAQPRTFQKDAKLGEMTNQIPGELPTEQLPLDASIPSIAGEKSMQNSQSVDTQRLATDGRFEIPKEMTQIAPTTYSDMAQLPQASTANATAMTEEDPLTTLDERLRDLGDKMEALSTSAFGPGAEVTAVASDRSSDLSSDDKQNEERGDSAQENAADKSMKVDEHRTVHQNFDQQLTTDTGKSQMAPIASPSPSMVENSTNVRGEQIKNLQAILDRAQVLAQRGGGEVRVQLNPQNLGHVNLKVSVADGRVNIQMVTESDQAKRMIESNIRDLNNELRSENLSLNKLQVDVGQSLSSDLKQSLDQQNQQNQDQAQNMTRDFARGFLGQQRDERMWQREQSLMDPLSMRGNNGYVKSRIEDDRSEASTQSLGTSGKARRLNVVV